MTYHEIIKITMRSIKTNKNNKDMEETELVLETKPLRQSK